MSRPAEILVVGAGTTGLTLALQARAHGAAVRIVDRRAAPVRPSRALILHPRTLEVLRPLGVTEALLAESDLAPEARVHLGARVVRASLANLALPDTAFPHLTLVRQMDVETVLARALSDRGVTVEWGTEVSGVSDMGDRTRADLRSAMGAERVRCDFVAGCDGPESTVRRAAGIGWRARPYAAEVVLADLELAGDLVPGAAHVAIGAGGLLFVFALGERATWRLLATRPARGDPPPYGQPGPAVPAAELQALLDRAGLDARIATVAWSARYRVQRGLADRFRQGRLFLAGDAAHASSPALGLSMNVGIQDAANLGWKLAFAPRATDAGTLLVSYEHERRPAVRRVLGMTHRAFWVEASGGPLARALRGGIAPLAAPLAPSLLRQRWLVAAVIRQVSQLRLAYPDSPISVEDGPRLANRARPGQRLPDAAVTTEAGPTRLHALLARPGLHVLRQRDAAPLDIEAPHPCIAIHHLVSEPGTGVIAVRPDGYIGFHAGVAEPGRVGDWLRRIGALGA